MAWRARGQFGGALQVKSRQARAIVEVQQVAGGALKVTGAEDKGMLQRSSELPAKRKGLEARGGAPEDEGGFAGL